mgnify:CR=1 FL=1
MGDIKNLLWIRVLHKIEDGIIIIATAFILIMTIVNVLCRYVLMSAIIWSDEIIGFGMLTIGLIGTATCVRDKLNTNLDGLVCKFPHRVQIVFYIAINLLVMLLLGYFAFSGFKFLSMVGNQRSAMLHWPMFIFYGMIPVSCVLYIVENIINIIDDIHKGNCRFIPIEEQYNITENGSEEKEGG